MWFWLEERMSFVMLMVSLGAQSAYAVSSQASAFNGSTCGLELHSLVRCQDYFQPAQSSIDFL